MANRKLAFTSDYMEGAHPRILEALTATNMEQTPGYGLDPFCESAKDRIRAACERRDAAVYFLSGGTQTNAVVITALLKPWQGVVSAATGHIASHEAGAIEAGGHKVLTLPEYRGKIASSDLEALLRTYDEDANHDHMVMPGMVYISQPTEYGTLYSLEELRSISKICRRWQIPLYADGARLAYALASPENTVTLPDLARLCDAFYIGGTKCGALLGEALVIPNPDLLPHFFTIIKQRGALLAKGRVLGIQFDALFTDGLYDQIGKTAIAHAERLQDALEQAGIPLMFRSPTNQIFAVLEDEMKKTLDQYVDTSFWEKPDASHTTVRIATSWATSQEDVDALIDLLTRFRKA